MRRGLGPGAGDGDGSRGGCACRLRTGRLPIADPCHGQQRSAGCRIGDGSAWCRRQRAWARRACGGHDRRAGLSCRCGGRRACGAGLQGHLPHRVAAPPGRRHFLRKRLCPYQRAWHATIARRGGQGWLRGVCVHLDDLANGHRGRQGDNGARGVLLGRRARADRPAAQQVRPHEARRRTPLPRPGRVPGGGAEAVALLRRGAPRAHRRAKPAQRQGERAARPARGPAGRRRRPPPRAEAPSRRLWPCLHSRRADRPEAGGPAETTRRLLAPRGARSSGGGSLRTGRLAAAGGGPARLRQLRRAGRGAGARLAAGVDLCEPRRSHGLWRRVRQARRLLKRRCVPGASDADCAEMRDVCYCMYPKTP
mmetsp:Transcript_26812/g.87212  ORF Transcript_26812/g.87212 Transcript_26812/m.87212 type:complete len:366 (-) Transcript_26812:19-1116(-)